MKTAVLATAPETLLDRPARLPRVNLLPPEIGQLQRFRRVQYGLGGAVAGALALVTVLVVLATADVSSAGQDLATTQAATSQLQKETSTYADVTDAYRRAASAQAMLSSAMGSEVRYSGFLSDLSLTVPDNLWIKSLVFSQTPTPGGPGTAGSAVGTVTFTGVAFGHVDVAVFLDALAGQHGYSNPYFTSSKAVKLGPRSVVEFSATATLTPDALTRRYTSPAGG